MVDGDIQTQRLHIAEGGRVNGQISMELTGERQHSERESLSAAAQQS